MDQPLRANSPTDDFSVLDPVVDEVPFEQSVTQEHKDLARAGKSKDGQIILDHLQKRVDDYMNTLKNAAFAEVDPVNVAVAVMTAQAVIKEFEGVLNDVELSKQVIKDAASKSRG